MADTTLRRGRETQSEAPPRASGRLRLLPAVLSGLYSWALTVFPVLLAEEPLGLAGTCALVALVSLPLSLLLPSGRLAMTAALDVFVIASGAAWWLSKDLGVGVPFPIFGSLGWLCYTLAVGAVSMPPARKQEPNRVQDFRPRTPPSRLAAAALLLSLLAGVALLLFAWKVERPHISVLAQVLALSAALLLLRAGASLAVHFQRRGTPIRSELGLRRAVVPLVCFLSLAVAATLWLLMPG